MPKIIKPEVPETLFYGNITNWEFRNGITKDKGKYCIRFTLFFESGNSVNKQLGGFKTEKLALKMKEEIIFQLKSRSFIPFSYTVQQYFDYWLYYYCLDKKNLNYNSFYSYRNVMYSYLLPKLSGNMTDITIDQLVSAMRSIDKISVKKQSLGVVSGIFKQAVNERVISFNPAVAAIAAIRVDLKTVNNSMEKHPVYSIDQVRWLLYKCKELYPDMYMPLLLSCTLGTRISETLALKYADIDYTNKWISVTRQIGGSLEDSNLSIELDTKTYNSHRRIPLSDFVIEEVLIKRKQYEENMAGNPDFIDNDYICCRKDGTAFHRSSFKKSYYELLDICKLPKIVWHDLRHTYATILSEDNDINLKSELCKKVTLNVKMLENTAFYAL